MGVYETCGIQGKVISTARIINDDIHVQLKMSAASAREASLPKLNDFFGSKLLRIREALITDFVPHYAKSIDFIVCFIAFMETTTVNNEWALNGLAHASCVCLSFRD